MSELVKFSVPLTIQILAYLYNLRQVKDQRTLLMKLLPARNTKSYNHNQVILAGTLTGVQGDIRRKVLVALSIVKYLLVT